MSKALWNQVPRLRTCGIDVEHRHESSWVVERRCGEATRFWYRGVPPPKRRAARPAKSPCDRAAAVGLCGVGARFAGYLQRRGRDCDGWEVGGPGCLLTIAAVADPHDLRLCSQFVADRAAQTSTFQALGIVLAHAFPCLAAFISSRGSSVGCGL